MKRNFAIVIVAIVTAILLSFVMIVGFKQNRMQYAKYPIIIISDDVRYQIKEYTEENNCVIFYDMYNHYHKICGNYQIIK